MVNIKPILWGFPDHEVYHVEHFLLICILETPKTEYLVSLWDLFGENCIFVVTFVGSGDYLGYLVLIGIHACYSLDPVTWILEHFYPTAVFADGECLIEKLVAVIDAFLSLHGHNVIHFQTQIVLIHPCSYNNLNFILPRIFFFFGQGKL